ncbi:hypothetical protein [Paraburkholderia steynii]|uniref:hypothetical protein n=1 Tax=Paraburkholderia steynii TaxID=1245441 RepID=UPI00115F7A42|nr:hypothetical protein [Paraburkholderia steynii]
MRRLVDIGMPRSRESTGSVGSLAITRFLERRLLTYSAEGVTVIEKHDQVDGLSITHNGHAVERLTRSRIRLWNAGRKAIEPGDVVSTNPLKVRYPGATLLDLKVVHSTHEGIKFRSRPDGDGWLIEFDYWEGKSGVILEALHTSTRVVPTLTGSVRGLRPIKSFGRIDDGAFLSPRRQALLRWLPVLALAVFGAGIAAVVRLGLWFDPRSILGFAVVAPGELLLIAAVPRLMNNFWIPRPLRRIPRRSD